MQLLWMHLHPHTRQKRIQVCIGNPGCSSVCVLQSDMPHHVNRSSLLSINSTAPSDQRKRYNRKRDTSGKKDKAQQKRYNINKQLFAASNKDRIGTILAQQASVFDADNISVAMHCLGHSKRCGVVGMGGAMNADANVVGAHRPEEATIAEVFKLAEDNLDQLLPHHLAVCVWYVVVVCTKQQHML